MSEETIAGLSPGDYPRKAEIWAFCDSLLTWNCNHLANAHKRQPIRIINARLNLSTPEIVTPLELFTDEPC